MNFTNQELSTISNAIITLIHNATTAKALLANEDTRAYIDKEIDRLVALNVKVCGMMES